MELPELTAHCEEPTCNRLDFLPYTCKCKKIFCADHYAIHTQTCAVVKEHYKEANLNATSQMWICSQPDCIEKSLVPLICEKCKQHFCVVHRHVTECAPEDPKIREAAIAKMRAPIEQFKEAKSKVDKELDTNLKKSKKQLMAIKVQLMRIKSKATGSNTIPECERVFFNIIKPAQYDSSEKAVWVSKLHTVGRTIDAIATECRVTNNNNMSNAQKLRLFIQTPEDQKEKLDLTNLIGDLLKDEVLVEGQNIFLEYCTE